MKIQSPETARTSPLVRDVMKRGVITVAPDMSVTELANLLTTRMISGAPVIDPTGEVVGVVSLADIAAHSARGHGGMAHDHRKRSDYYTNVWFEEDESSEGFYVEDYAEQATVADIMTPVVHLVRETDSIADLARLLLSARIHRALVTDGKTVIGIVTSTDLVRLLSTMLSERPA
jgi:predicted transcriptional regulator